MALHCGWAGAGPVVAGLPAGDGPLAEPARVAVGVQAGQAASLEAAIDPAALALEPAALDGARHWLRLADGTVRPLPPRPGRLRLERGDSYVAVVGAAGAAEALTAARFIHLRDYFNAGKLAQALLEELEAARPAGQGLGVLVVECR